MEPSRIACNFVPTRRVLHRSYDEDNPIRVYKAIEIIRHPDYGSSVAPPSSAVDAIVPFAGAPHTSYAFGNTNRGPVEFGPRAAGAVVIEAPLFAFAGGVSHAGWKVRGWRDWATFILYTVPEFSFDFIFLSLSVAFLMSVLISSHKSHFVGRFEMTKSSEVAEICNEQQTIG